MSTEEYEKILKEGERVDWHGTQVPSELINGNVTDWADQLKQEIDKIESELSDLRVTQLDKRKTYLQALYNNLQESPYKLNGDFYLIKKKRIEKEMEEESKKKTTKTNKKPSSITTQTVDTSRKTKKSDLIFGKNKK